MSVDQRKLEHAHESINTSISNVMNAGIPTHIAGLDAFVYLNIMYANNAYDMYNAKIININEYIKHMEATKSRMMEADTAIKSLDSTTPCKTQLLKIFEPFYKKLITCSDKHDESCTNAGQIKRERAKCAQPLKQLETAGGGLVTTDSDKLLLKQWSELVIMNINKCNSAFDSKVKNKFDDNRYLQELKEARVVMGKIFENYKSMVGRYPKLTIDMEQFESYFLPFYSALIHCPQYRSACDRAHETKVPFFKQNTLS